MLTRYSSSEVLCNQSQDLVTGLAMKIFVFTWKTSASQRATIFRRRKLKSDLLEECKVKGYFQWRSVVAGSLHC